MSMNYKKYVEVLPSQTTSFVETPNSQDTIVFKDLNYYCSLWDSYVYFSSVTIASPGNNNRKPIILCKKGPFRKLSLKESNVLLFEETNLQ